MSSSSPQPKNETPSTGKTSSTESGSGRQRDPTWGVAKLDPEEDLNLPPDQSLEMERFLRKWRGGVRPLRTLTYQEVWHLYHHGQISLYYARILAGLHDPIRGSVSMSKMREEQGLTKEVKVPQNGSQRAHGASQKKEMLSLYEIALDPPSWSQLTWRDVKQLLDREWIDQKWAQEIMGTTPFFEQVAQVDDTLAEANQTVDPVPEMVQHFKDNPPIRVSPPIIDRKVSEKASQERIPGLSWLTPGTTSTSTPERKMHSSYLTSRDWLGLDSGPKPSSASPDETIGSC